MSGNIGWSEIDRIRRVEENANALGFAFAPSKYRSPSENRISLIPLAESWPIYTRDAVLFSGNLNEIESWLFGIQHARTYDALLRLSFDKKRRQAEIREVARIAKMLDEKEKREIVRILSE